MKKIWICLALACLLLSFAGCGSTPSGDADIENANADRNDPVIDEVTLTTEIKELESGFSAVKYDGDYAFDLFLEQGGADSDQAVLRFLTDHLLGGNTGLQMGGGAFGCSTISVANTDGGYFFGRNFDWNACDALVMAAYPSNGYQFFE